MRPRRTHSSNRVYSLQDSNEDHDLWVEQTKDPEADWPLVKSVWEPDEDERRAIAGGANIELSIWGGQPPVAMGVTTVALGKPPDADGAAGERG